MKIFLIFISTSFLMSCGKAYEDEEFKAINDFANDYLEKNILNRVLNPESIPSPPGSSNEGELAKPNIDSLDLKVYFSDALLPIAQVKEDNEWMFEGNYNGSDSIIFYKIVNSDRFKELDYREYNKSKLKLIKPFSQFKKSQEKIGTDEVYTILNFSRVCFDDKKENGIVVVEYSEGSDGGTMFGYHMALLIKKKGETWTYIPRK